MRRGDEFWESESEVFAKSLTLSLWFECRDEIAEERERERES